jgi:hypothetical protein
MIEFEKDCVSELLKQGAIDFALIVTNRLSVKGLVLEPVESEGS